MRLKGIYKDSSILLDNPLDIKNGTEVSVEIKKMDDFIDIPKWDITRNDFYDINPIKIRNLIIKCFLHAHLKEVIGKKSKRVTYSDYEISKQSIMAEVELTFNQVGGNYNNPSKACLLKVINLLAEKQKNRGISNEIINHHKFQLIEAINYLPAH